jgi:uncharacterized protein (TIGR02147 family)
MENTSHQNFVHYLQNELIRRCRDNPNYSLRAFARGLGIDQSLLSKILRGKKSISQKMIFDLSRSLRIPRERQQEFTRDNGLEQKKIQLMQDQFEFLADWYHMAILELAQLKHFKSDPKWIAATLGITVSEVNIAVDRLLRYEFIKIKRNGRWQIFRPNNNWTNTNATTSARKQYQKQLLDKAASAINQVDYNYRHNTSVTVAVNSKMISEFKALLNKYRDDLEQVAQKSDGHTDVYQFCLAFYPLTNIENKK